MEPAATSHAPDQADSKPVIESGWLDEAAQVKPRQRSRRKTAEVDDDPSKRRCVSTACIACRRRKSKCDGNVPACAACSQVYGTECIYDPNSDHRRKGVYKNDVDNLKTRNSTLHTLIQAILNFQEEEAFELVREIRTCESLDAVAERIVAKEHGLDLDDGDDQSSLFQHGISGTPTFETQLYGKMGDLRLDGGSVRHIGGTSNLIHIDNDDDADAPDEYPQQENAVTSWTTVTDDPNLVLHLLNMYFTWHYAYFTTLSKTLFFRDFLYGKPPPNTRRRTHYCTSLLVNAMLALGSHFTSHTGARENPEDSATAGDHFFKEAKRLLMDGDVFEEPRLTTVQALALMSVREAGCAREAKGWVYSGMSFRMACDMGLNLNSGQLTKNKHVNGDEAEEDVRRITFWGCFLFDKCWSNYLGRLPQLPTSIVTAPKFEVFPDEDSALWSPYTDSGFSQAHSQPARTRAVALQISKLCEISNDIMKHFYNPTNMEKSRGKSAELKMLSDIHTRLETWRRELPKEMEPREGCLSSILVMHMFFQLLFIHLFRPFLKYTQATSPLPQTVSPRKLCTQAAAMISKLMRLYKRSLGLRQICNIAVYIAHSACTIHLLNLPDKNAKRDIVHGVKHLEEIAEGWLCARRSLVILSVLARKWKVELPDEAITVLARTDKKFGRNYRSESQSPNPQKQQQRSAEQIFKPVQLASQQTSWQSPTSIPTSGGYINNAQMPAVSPEMQQTAQAARTNSGQYRLPPQNANDLNAQQLPPAQSTPQDTRQQRTSQDQKASSPSDMFGGVEQLLRDSSDWVYRDQAQLANGFENWQSFNMDPSIWANGILPQGNVGTNPMSTGDAGGGMIVPTTSQASNTFMAPNTISDSMNGYLIADWMNGMNAGNEMATYNEAEWYQ